MEKNNNIPLVSICCLAYNHEAFIRQALDSFLMQQTNFAFEIVIHDDASTDNTAKIIEEYTQKYPEIFKPLLQTENQRSKFGGGMNPRFNFPRARGKYIAVCEGDDYWTDPNKLQRQVDFLESNNNSAGCFHHVKYINANGDTISEIYNERVGEFEHYNQEQCLKILKSSYATCSLMFKTNELKNAPEGLKISYYCDEVLDLAITENGVLSFLNFNAACYRFHTGGVWSGTKSFKIKKNLYDRTINLTKVPVFKKRYYSHLRDRIKELAQDFLFTNAISRKERIKYFLNTLKYLDYTSKSSYTFIAKFIKSIIKK